MQQMGLFSKLRADINHGGVKLQIQLPSSVAANQLIPVTVNITADTPCTINSLTAELQSQARQQGVSFGNNNGTGGNGVGMNQSTSNYQKVAEVKNSESFTVNPGETKTVSMQLYLNGNATGANPLGQLTGAAGAVGGVLQSLASAAQNLEHVTYTYRVHVSADVDGVGIGPSGAEPIQIIPAAAGSQPAGMAQSVVAENSVPTGQPTQQPPASPGQPTSAAV
jgi:hypothetical protein